ncbi:hypothetical protein [Halobacterium zhouii]|uniref:hypothetical protein n=1 Tax=Halobacterium zhouii TaxID=2902624 RepID=UPI001E3EE3C0|nr:hypothetical protein [Halobacterium zhouii]
MKHTLSGGEKPQDIDTEGDLFHTAEMHSFDATDETALTSHAACPHCDYDTHATDPRRVGRYMLGSSVVALALMLTGFPNIGTWTVVLAMILSVFTSDNPGIVHCALARVGL